MVHRPAVIFALVLCGVLLLRGASEGTPALAAPHSAGIVGAHALSTATDLTESGTDEVGVLEQAHTPRTCADLQPTLAPLGLTDITLVASSADLLPDGGPLRLCAYFNNPAQTYSVWLLNQRSADDFRQTKATFLPLLADAGIDPCRVAAWTPYESAVQRATNGRDWHDTGRRCDPQVIAHGPKSAQRVDELHTLLDEAAGRTEELFGWALTWPLLIHAYDDHDGFVAGVRAEAGSHQTPPRSVTGMTSVSSVRMTNVLLDTEDYPTPTDLLSLLAHEYHHVTQYGVLGCACDLPFFVAEGGAELFASVMVGPENPNLSSVFQEAKHDVLTNKVTPLAQLIAERAVARDAPYTRGYAAMLFLASRWGLDAFVQLYLGNDNGTPAAYLDRLSALTGLGIDEFDAALTEFIRAQHAYVPAPGPTTTLESNSALIRLYAVRRGEDDTAPEVSRFTRSDTGLELYAQWDCFDHRAAAEIVFFRPDGQHFATYPARLPIGCTTELGAEFRFDDRSNGLNARAWPGQWRVQVFAEGVLQGTYSFTLEGQ